MDNMERTMQQIVESLAKAEADRKADKEDRKADQEKMAADRKADEENMAANRKADQEKMVADKEDFLARMDAFHEKRMAMLEAQQRRMIACLGQTDANTEKMDPGMMQSAEEHQDVPNEDVAVMPVGEPRKRRRGRKLIAERRGEPKELNRGNHGSRRKLAAACRRCPAMQQWHGEKGNSSEKVRPRDIVDGRKG
jgi:hypothetical protein